MKYGKKLLDICADKNFLIKLISGIVQTVILAEMVRNLLYGMESMYQIERDIFFFRAAALFSGEVLILNKARLYRLPYLAAIIGYSIYVAKVMKEYTVDLYGVTLVQWKITLMVAQGVFLLALVGCVCSIKVKSHEFTRKWYGIFTVLVFALIVGLNEQFSLPVLFPVLALYFTSLSKKEWKNFLCYLAIGYYLAFFWIFTQSLRTIPYESGHYLGVFLNYATAGSFCAGAFLSALYGFWWGKIKEKKICMILCGIAMVYPLIGVLMCGERSSELGIIIAVLASFIFLGGKEAKSWKRRGMIVLIASAGALLLFVCVLLLLSRLDSEAVGESISNKALSYKVSYWIRRGQTLLNFKSKLGVIPEGSWLNPIDWFSSDRLSYFIDSIRKTKLLGSNDMTVGNKAFFNSNPHNAYAVWLRMYGWLGGLSLIAWFIMTFFYAAKRMISRDFTMVFPFIWIVYTAVYGLAEAVPWKYTMGFIFLVMFYPIVIKLSEGSKTEAGRNSSGRKKG